MVKTLGFQPSNPGSIPGGITKILLKRVNEMDAKEILEHTAWEQDWTDATCLIVLTQFVDSLNLVPELEEYLINRQMEEEAHNILSD
jgi:hypothetical protein